jgi:2-oxoglutarate/2-oxoacid ferredoxin oxidoreductase subunit beta
MGTGRDASNSRDHAIIPLVHGQPITFGTFNPTTGLGDKGIIRDSVTGGVKVIDLGPNAAERAEDYLLVHDAHNPDPSTAFAISRLTDSGYLNRSPIGIFRQVERPTYDDGARAQVAEAIQQRGRGRLQQLLDGGDNWTVSDEPAPTPAPEEDDHR